jgi:hypothetical protein
MLMFVKRQINSNKTKHEHVSIETRDIEINSNGKLLHKGGRWPMATMYEYKGMAPQRYILGPKPRLIN